NIDLPNAIRIVKAISKKYNPNYPFEYFFVDDAYAHKFTDIQQNRNQSRIYAVLIILICCFGLGGLTALIVANRTKEIGIRKVLGASTLNITAILAKDFLKLVVVAIVLAIPVAYYIMNEWLGKFIFRTKLGLTVFVISGGISLLVALVAIIYNTIKAASANPAITLKSL
ncbi:MAG TPA: FtsX-like permease family protein, partial [Chryseolinea sp.]|nr:FtsX-like permease family protein [Chryseolinea sp.]